MIAVALALMAASSGAVDHPTTYVASITGLQLKRDERIDSFAISTWGVTFNAICHIPDGWTLMAGRRANPEGVLEGEGSNGVTWLGQTGLRELEGLALVTLYGPVQQREIVTDGGAGVIPASFKGTASVVGDNAGRTISLTSANIRLAPAKACPATRP